MRSDCVALYVMRIFVEKTERAEDGDLLMDMTTFKPERMNVMSVVTADRALKQEVEKTLRRLYINGTRLGLKYLVYAVSETVLEPERTRLITKDLYREIARKYKTTPNGVERDIRSAICVCWENAKEELDQMVGCHLVKRPTNKEFIDHIAFYIRNK